MAIVFTANAFYGQLTVSLKLDESARSTIGQSLLCDENYNCGLLQKENSKMSLRRDDVLVKITRAGKDFSLVVDSNLNGRLNDERPVLLRNSGTVQMRIRKQLSSRRYVLRPFDITHSVEEEKGVMIDTFMITPHYVASGRLKTKTCSANISLSDMNYDGLFTLADSNRGTNMGIDRNNDGKFWGKEEFSRTVELIEFCGQNYFVSTLNNRFMVLMPTHLKFAKVNENVPSFSAKLLNGMTISSEYLKGKTYVLDFWATWCVPCVQNLPTINRIKSKYESISVFSVNVDEAARRDAVEKVVNDAGLREFTVVRGMGNNDPLWKTFGGMNSNHLVIPLYVLVDKQGVIRYAGGGGERLESLESAVAGLLKTR